MTGSRTLALVVPVLALVASASVVSCDSSPSAADVLFSAYESCVRYGSFACVKPKLLAFLGDALGKDTVKITRDLTVVRTSDAHVNDVQGDIRDEVS